MWDLCHVHPMFMYTHICISLLACSLSSCCVVLFSCLRSSISTVVLYVIAATCVFFCFFVCFFSACLLSGAPVGSKAGFPTEAVDCLLFCFYRCSSSLFRFSLFSLIVSFHFCSVYFSLLFLFPFPLVLLGTITC